MTTIHVRTTVIAALVVVTTALGGAVPVGPVAARSPGPRVAVIVGPVGSLTDTYRARGERAAAAAERAGADVIRVFSPNATWPAARRAMDGAAIVVYLGHGNGFPSPYRSEPWPRTQNGLGLNPVAGVDDVAHQYFGEAFLARDVRLARGATVVLSRLCYASGNPEPGGPEPTSAVARQRADNYGAGWIAAGATAVVADAFAPPEEYVARILSTRDTIESLWRTASTRNGHVLTSASQRTVGGIVLLDPDRPGAGFFRSLVWKPGEASTRAPNGHGGMPAQSAVPPSPSLAASGVRPAPPQLSAAVGSGELVVGRPATLALALDLPAGMELPAGLRLGVRWERLDPPRDSAAGQSGEISGPAAPDAATPDAAPSSEAQAPPRIDLVAPEAPAAVVASVPASVSGSTLSVTVDLPAEPGRYRVTTSLHDAGDVAFDAPTQDLIDPLLVRVSAPLSVAYGVADSVSLKAGGSFDLPVRLANSGSMPWSPPPITFDAASGRGRYNDAPLLVGRWVPLAANVRPPDVATTTVARLDPGQTTVAVLHLQAPTTAGSYLLLIDLVSPVHGSLAASGAGVGQVSVEVLPASGGNPVVRDVSPAAGS